MSNVDRVNIREEDRKIYTMIRDQGPLKGRTNKELFLLAMSLGIKKNNRIPYGSKHKDGWFLLKDLTNKEMSLFRAIAIAESSDLDILIDKSKVFLIAEEYANGGIHLLKQEIFEKEGADFEKRLESLLRKELENNFK
ncbi:MAG: hypothetical protein NT129_00795 [Candidatus Aenigmarchaeota archaeon]|nr:hypothetical protein [Candidatus Aenigmarchaeota archaeon]